MIIELVPGIAIRERVKDQERPYRSRARPCWPLVRGPCSRSLISHQSCKRGSASFGCGSVWEDKEYGLCRVEFVEVCHQTLQIAVED